MDYRTEQLIELYFANAISEAESLELKTILAANPDAAAEFAWQQNLAKQVTKRSLAQSIRNEAWREAAKPPFRQATMIRTFLAAAAGLALLIAACYLIPYLSSGNSDALVAASFEHFPNKMKFKNLGETTETISPDVLDAFADYDKQQYASAAAKLTSVVNFNPTRSDYRFYLGVAFVGARKYFESINILTSVVQDTTSAYNTPARYYLGVACAGIHDVPQARKYLQEYINAPDGVPFRKPAEKLLRSLE